MGKLLYSTEQIIEALKETKGMVYVAAERLGCAPVTIYKRAKISKAVQDEIDKQRGKMVDIAELKFYQAIQNGEPWAIAMMLKTVGKGRGYVEKQIIDNQVSGEMTVYHANLDPDARAAIEEAERIIADRAASPGV